jgi:hypothetical protein
VESGVLKIFVAKAIEYMIVDGLILADPHLKIADRIEIPKKFVHLTDDIMNRIEDTEDPVRPVQPYACIT